MGHPQAAALVGFGYLNNILPITRYNDGKWASIKENIKASGVGVIGTGHGYAITHALAARGNQLAVELLLEKGASIEGRDENGRTMLHWAAEGGHERLVKFLLEKGADMDSKTTSGKKAVTLAYRKGYQVIVDLLKDSLSWNTMVYWPVKHRK